MTQGMTTQQSGNYGASTVSGPQGNGGSAQQSMTTQQSGDYGASVVTGPQSVQAQPASITQEQFQQLMQLMAQQNLELEQHRRLNQNIVDAHEAHQQQTWQRQGLNPRADTVVGHALGFQGSPRVTVVQGSDGRPVSGLQIKFTTATLGLLGGISATNQQGVAECSVSSLNPFFLADAALSGYYATFEGDTNYLPFRTHGIVVPFL